MEKRKKMKYLKLYEEHSQPRLLQSKDDINSYMSEHWGSVSYKIREDFSIDILGDFNYRFIYNGNDVEDFKVKINKINGEFRCSSVIIYDISWFPESVGTLEFVKTDFRVPVTIPKTRGDISLNSSNFLDDKIAGMQSIVYGDLEVNLCGLKTLENFPTRILGSFNCNNNQLGSLVGGPSKVEGSYSCEDNNLTNLDGAPTRIGGNFNAMMNGLTSLKGSPVYVGGDMNLSSNEITSVSGSLEYVEGKLILKHNKLVTLEGYDIEQVDELNVAYNNIKTLRHLSGKEFYGIEASGNYIKALYKDDLPQLLDGYGDIKLNDNHLVFIDESYESKNLVRASENYLISTKSKETYKYSDNPGYNADWDLIKSCKLFINKITEKKKENKSRINDEAIKEMVSIIQNNLPEIYKILKNNYNLDRFLERHNKFSGQEEIDL